MELVLATRNAHKLREFAALLAPHRIVALPEEVALPPETGDSFAANSMVKALAAARATGTTAIADDSGIEAYALGGRPGIYSARYAGEGATDEQNLAKLLDEVPVDGDRRAAYVCALSYAEPEGRSTFFEARCTGRLALTPRGEGGFGYDPAFIPDEIPGERSFAEVPQEQKDRISHRGRAARALLDWLAAGRP